MKKTTIFCVLLLIFIARYKAQDVHFSQINEQPLFLSPANTGFFNGYVRAIINYRNQWTSMGGFGSAYNTGAISVDGGLFKSKKRKSFLGLGGTIVYDRAGAANLSKTTAMLNASGIIKSSRRSVIGLGISGGINSNNANYNKLTYGSQFDGNVIDNQLVSGESVVFRQFTTTDIGAGFAYEYTKISTDEDHDDVSKFRLSIGAFHLNRPVQDFGAGSNYKLPVRWVGAYTSHFDFEDTKFSITPTFVMQSQGEFYQILFGTYLKYRLSTGTKTTGTKTETGMGIGLFYRSKDALIAKFMYEADKLAFGLSYDINLSGYKAVSRLYGGPEVFIRLNNMASSLFDSRREFK
jgi:type IX secretion system PorP/SprF family membrane protein